MDGIPGITQCPIVPTTSFSYGFSSVGQAGTFWYHTQALDTYNGGGSGKRNAIHPLYDGPFLLFWTVFSAHALPRINRIAFLPGPLIIYDPNDPQANLYDVDDESTVVMLSDYYHAAPVLGAVEPTPDNGLINGLNPFGSSIGPRSVFNFVKGKRYRLRVINSGAYAAFQFSIDNHRLTVIEVDGVSIQPVSVDRIPINVGQRYSVIVEAKQVVGNYWMRAIMNTNCFSTQNSALNPLVKAIVHYSGAPNSADPISNDWTSVPWSGGCMDIDSSLLKPLVPRNAPAADQQIILMSFDTSPSNTLRGNVNGASWVPPTDPTLLQVLKGATDATKLLPAGTVIVLDKTQTVEVVINSMKWI